MMHRTLYERMMYENHIDRMKKIKSTLDNKPPPPNPCFFSKKWELEYNRKITKINKENNILANRLVNVESSLDNIHSKRLEEVRKFKKEILEKKYAF